MGKIKDCVACLEKAIVHCLLDHSDAEPDYHPDFCRDHILVHLDTAHGIKL